MGPSDDSRHELDLQDMCCSTLTAQDLQSVSPRIQRQALEM
jgi:hypothetical protein